MSLETVTTLMLNATPEALPLLALAGVWLWNVAEDGKGAAFCVDGCLTLHYALAEYGIASRVEAVILDVEGNVTHGRFGGNGPHDNANGTFNGHAVLVVPEADRLLDPTLQQYREVPDTEAATIPLMVKLNGTSLDPAEMEVARSDHRVRYHPRAGAPARGLAQRHDHRERGRLPMGGRQPRGECVRHAAQRVLPRGDPRLALPPPAPPGAGTRRGQNSRRQAGRLPVPPGWGGGRGSLGRYPMTRSLCPHRSNGVTGLRRSSGSGEQGVRESDGGAGGDEPGVVEPGLPQQPERD